MKRAGHKFTGKKRGSVTYSTDRENEVSKIFILSLRLIGRAEKEISKVSGPITARVLTKRYNKIRYTMPSIKQAQKVLKPVI